MNDNLFIFHIGNGKNFEKSKHLNTWGIIKTFENSIKKFNSNSILIFVKKGNIIIGFAKFKEYYNRKDKKLDKLDWINDEKYQIIIEYEDLCEFKKEIKFINNLGQSPYIKFDEYKHKIDCEYNLLDIINIKYISNYI